MRGRVVGIELFILVMRRMVVNESKRAIAGPPLAQVKLAGNGKDAVAHRFRFKLAAVHAPKKLVGSIHLLVRLAIVGRLAVNGAGTDEPMELLQRAAVIAQLGGEPIEQFRVAGPRAIAAEVVGSVNQTSAEMIMPHPIRHRAPRERILGVSDPVS